MKTSNDILVFKGLVITYCVNLILEHMPDLKNTLLYSKSVESALELYSKTKQSKLYRNPEAADEALSGSVLIERLTYASLKIGEQPAHVQKRFDAELDNLLIRYGVLIPEQ